MPNQNAVSWIELLEPGFKRLAASINVKYRKPQLLKSTVAKLNNNEPSVYTYLRETYVVLLSMPKHIRRLYL